MNVLYVFQVLVIETLHTCGLMILMYWCLPLLDGTRAILLMTGVGFIPSILRPFIKQHKAITVIDVFVIFVQFTAAIFYPIFTGVNPNIGAKCPRNLNNFSVLPGNLTEDLSQFWPVPLAVILVSLSYWENFVDEKNHLGKLGDRLWELKKAIHKTRTKTNVIAYTWKLTLTLAMIFPMFLWKYPGRDVAELFNSANFKLSNCLNEPPWTGPTTSPLGIDVMDDWIVLYFVQAGVSLVGYYTATLTVMGSVQVATYTLAVTLATPASLGVLQWACLQCGRFWTFETFAFFNCLNGWSMWTELASERWTYIGFFWWISQLWLTRHLWMPTIERMARTDRYIKLLFIH